MAWTKIIIIMMFYKEIIKEIKEVDNSDKKLKDFGFLIGGIFCIFGVILLLKSHDPIWFFIPGFILIILAVIRKEYLKWPYLIWMSLALILGYIVFRIVFTILYYVVVTPVGITKRLVKGDFLNQKIDKGKSSYWLAKDREPQSNPDEMF